MTQSEVDIFDDIAEADAEDQQEAADTAEATGTEIETENKDEAEPAVVVVNSIPENAMSVTEFAAHLTQTFMREKILAGEDLGTAEYVVPQAVYQTTKALKDRIPHVLVKDDEDKEPRVYILTEEALAWWRERKDRLATRGAGAKSASSRTPEDNMTLLGEAVKKFLYAETRQKMWVERVEQSQKLVDKYRGFLKDAKVSEETMETIVQEAREAFDAEQSAKAEAKKNKKSESTD